jgi:hypothetical protein
MRCREQRVSELASQLVSELAGLKHRPFKAETSSKSLRSRLTLEDLLGDGG